MAAVATPRAQTIVQRAYVYIVALVAVHMIVLGVANLLRVFAEIALGASSGGFTGLPFVFGDFNRPRDLYREQASLAIALLVVGTPAWWWHFRLAERAAGAVEERASALRSLYVHVVIFVTALLVFGYGQRALRLVLQGTSITPSNAAFFPIEADWQARAAGAAAMALAAGLALAFHLRLSVRDRRSVAIDGRAAAMRHLALYALVVIGFLFATLTTGTVLMEIWQRVVDSFVTLPGIERFPAAPPGLTPPPRPNQDDILRNQLIEQVPTIVAGLALWLGTWIPLQRGLVAATDAEVERRSTLRKVAIYLIVLFSVAMALIGATASVAAVIQRILGDPIVGQTTSLWHDLAGPVTGLVVFAPMWLFHRRVVQAEAARESEVARAATIRRLYTYLISATGLAMAAVGIAGTLGVIGSAFLGLNAHTNQETAIYLSLAMVGAAAWAFHWRAARARLDDDERRSLPRRLYLYLAILGGVLGLLVFGSAVLYRVFNGLLAFSFPLATWHDIWHFVVDAAVSGVVAWSAFRVMRADRAVLGSTAEDLYEVKVLVRAADRAAAWERVAKALAGETDLSVKP